METESLTTELLWRSTLYAIVIDIPIVIIIAKYISNEIFRKLKWYLVGAAIIIYAIIWGTFGSILFWDIVYKNIFPAWIKFWLPVIYGLLYGIFAFLFWKISILIKRFQVILFITLGGLISLVGHSIGIRLGLFNVPMLSKASIESALIFGVFEFIFYWCVIVCLGVLGRIVISKIIWWNNRN